MVEIIFVYIGDKIPNYAYDSLNHASKYNSVTLICNSKKISFNKLEGVDVIDLDKFYIKPQFLDSYMADSKKIRNGFWIKTFERLIVLEQYSSFKGIKNYFHAELDNLVFNVNGLANRLDGFEGGIFIPLIDVKHLIPSLIYVKDNLSLKEFIEWVYDSNYQDFNETQLLALYWKDNPSKIRILPTTISTNPENRHEQFPLTTRDVNGIFDASIIGHYLLGVDPKNKIGPILNGYTNPLNYYFNLKEYRFKLGNTGDLYLCQGLNNIYVYNLHIHSKKISNYTNLKIIGNLVSRHNNVKRTLISINIASLFTIFIRLSNRTQKRFIRKMWLL